MYNERIKSNVPKMSVFASERATKLGAVGKKSSLHYHDELEFLIVRAGEFIITVDGVDHVAKAGEVAFINSGVPHETRADVPCIEELVQFRESDFINGEPARIIKYSRRFNSLTESPVSIISYPPLWDALNEIIDESDKKGTAHDLFIKAATLKALACLYRLGIKRSADELLASHDMQKILPVLSFVNLHYSEDLGLKQASDMLNFDESYFCRIFKNATGATFTEYLNFVRICKAEKLLNKTQDSILEISEAVGFSSVSYFNRIFKRYRHLSPRAYRNMLYDNI